jgi:hypothetical protein
MLYERILRSSHQQVEDRLTKELLPMVTGHLQLLSLTKDTFAKHQWL